MKPWRTFLEYLIGLPGWELQCGHGGEAVENAHQRLRLLRRPISFNAATAVKPWRTGSAPPIRRLPHGFNAATAEKPWRTIYFSIPGNKGQELQCGHGGEAVENAALTFARIRNAYMLQCGHGGEAVENVKTVGDHLGVVCLASMRPRR